MFNHSNPLPQHWVKPRSQEMKLGEILVRRGRLSVSQVQEAMQNLLPHQRLGEYLVWKNLISYDEMHQALKEQAWRKMGYWVIG